MNRVAICCGACVLFALTVLGSYLFHARLLPGLRPAVPAASLPQPAAQEPWPFPPAGDPIFDGLRESLEELRENELRALGAQGSDRGNATADLAPGLDGVEQVIKSAFDPKR